MNKRIHTGDKFEVTDKKSPYFGKTVIFIEPRLIPKEMINFSGKVISSEREYHYIFKLENTETTEEFTLTQLRKV